MFKPDSLEDLKNWVKSRIDQKKKFRVCGKGSRFVNEVSSGSKLISKDILSLQKLNSKRFFDPEDMVIGLESGITIREMFRILGTSNMLLPANPWFPDSCVGSMVACNDFGPNRMNMGGLRDCLIGIEYINGKGELVKAGGKVVKNVAGYDLTRMLLGSQGGLGVITAINFKVIPKPKEPCGMYGLFENEKWLLKVKELHESKIPLDWIQASSTNDSKWILGLGFSGNVYLRQRIEKEINKIFCKTLIRFNDKESFPEEKFTPGEDRFNGFVKCFRDAWDIENNDFHIFATLPTENMLRLPIDLFLKENFKILIHPIGGDIHLIFKNSQRSEHLKLLTKIKSIINTSEIKMRWVSGSPKSSLEDFGEHAVASGYSLSKKLKLHLDPSRVFSSAYYDLSFEK